MAAGGATPRKFAEKIAMHNQKGAEENAEFNKIMSEIARVKGNAAAGTMQSPRVSYFSPALRVKALVMYNLTNFRPFLTNSLHLP